MTTGLITRWRDWNSTKMTPLTCAGELEKVVAQIAALPIAAYSVQYKPDDKSEPCVRLADVLALLDGRETGDRTRSSAGGDGG